MALQARPKHHMTEIDWQFADIFEPESMRGTGDLKAQNIYDREHKRHDGLMIECVLVHPPSSKGRTVYVHFSAEDVTKALVEFRESARDARQHVANGGER